jgi:predicted phage tail protein
MERIGMWAALAGIVILTVFSIWRVMSASDVSMVARLGAALVIAGVLVMLIAVGRQRMRDKKTENLDEVEP